jgi:hypothetical protein
MPFRTIGIMSIERILPMGKAQLCHLSPSVMLTKVNANIITSQIRNVRILGWCSCHRISASNYHLD